MNRLPRQPHEVLDRSQEVAFTWNGEPMVGFEGDTIVSALAAAGVRVFSRSFKYHRPRGVLAASYHDPNTILQVGSEPNVRAGHRRLEADMDVRTQGVWPSLKWDVRSANRLVGRFLSPGFYYKTFKAPAMLRPAYQAVLKRFASGGEVSHDDPSGTYDHRYAHPDVLVAGGGPAGMSAALAAADEGAQVMLVDDEHQLGGHLRWWSPVDLTELRSAVLGHAGIEVLSDSVVAGRYDHNLVSVVQRGLPHVTERLLKARAKVLVAATGTLERPYVFSGNDLPGVMLASAAQRLINLHAVKPGMRAVVMTANECGDAAVTALEHAGVEIAAVVDGRAGESVTAAQGRWEVASVELSDGRKLAADLLVTAVGWTTPTALLNMAGDRPRYDPVAARFLPGPLPDDVMATGGLVGDGTLEQLAEHASATGLEAARRALRIRARWRAATPGAIAADDQIPGSEAEPPTMPVLEPASHPELYRGESHGFVDFSEDVTSKDIFSAVAEGYDSIELAKRYTTATMGPVQGKLELVNAVAVHAEATGTTIGATGTTTWRPPVAPISLGALAGRGYEPVRRSPLQEWHEQNGADPLVAGQWIRPNSYGDPMAEVRAVRESVGMIDVSPLGKIMLTGTDVPSLLDFVYTNRWQRLAVGAVRYGVMCAEDGVVMDDGVTGRLAEHRYYMTTTSGGAGRVWNWLDEWLKTKFTEWDVRLTAVTDGFAAINVAGPASRSLLSKLDTDIALDHDSFPYMAVRQGTVAGVAGCIVWRIGFTGELSYELHVPANSGLAVWNSLLSAGAEFGVRPFGVEAQRVLRLEKGHFIVGQDTDGLTKAFSTGADRTVRLDKEDFAGRPELAWQAHEGSGPTLVAIQPLDRGVVPPEASQIVDADRQIVGRVTSSRWSPTLRRSVGLALVDRARGRPGTVLMVRLADESTLPVRVIEGHAHFDPEGKKLHG